LARIGTAIFQELQQSYYRKERMSRIPPNDDIRFPEQESASNMERLFRVMANRPEIAEQARKLLEVTMRSGSVEPKLKELLAVRVSQVNHCFY
jgi:alkylhydroperoxidase family enzyme